MIRIYAIAALIAVIGGALFYVDHLRKENARLTTDLAMANWAATEHERLAKEDREFARVALEKQDVFTRENNRLAADLESGKRKLRIRSLCPSQTGLPSEVRETDAELGENARRNFLNYRAVAGQVVIDFDECKARLKALSN